MRRKKAWIFSGGAVVVLVAASAVILPPMMNGDEAAAPTTTTSAATSAPAVVTPEPARTYPAVSSFYAQVGPPASSPQLPVEPQTLTVSSELTGTKLSSSQIGLSLEATDLADTTLSADNASMIAILQGLGKPVLRFGGNAVDRRFFWTSANEAIPAGYTGDAAHPVRSVNPADLERIMGLLDAADAYVTISVDLGHYDPARAADLVKHASATFGNRLASVTLGNEPNGFGNGDRRAGTYTADDYAVEAKAYADAIFAVAPTVPLSGPGTYAADWVAPWVELGAQQPQILTFHHYPLTGCTTGKAEDAPTMANLLSPTMHNRTVDYARTFVDKGNAAGMAVWTPETGISACTGSNETTKTYASALWSADYALSAAHTGVQQTSFHSSMITCTGGPPMSSVCAEGAYLKPTGVMDVRANYYGMSMVGTIGAGEFLKLDSSGGGLTYSYAIQLADGSTTVVLVNENDPTTAAQTNVTLTLPKIAATATMTQMTGPSYAAQDGVLIDGVAAAPVAIEGRPAPMGFVPGQQTQTFPLTAGTVTVMNFTY